VRQVHADSRATTGDGRTGGTETAAEPGREGSEGVGDDLRAWIWYADAVVAVGVVVVAVGVVVVVAVVNLVVVVVVVALIYLLTCLQQVLYWLQYDRIVTRLPTRVTFWRQWKERMEHNWIVTTMITRNRTQRSTMLLLVQSKMLDQMMRQ